MLWNASGINGYAIAASDGRIGTVSDFWLSGRKVLLPPSMLGHLDAKEEECSVTNLTKQQVKDSPEIDTDQPVSRQMETSVYDYYGWSPYWGTGFYMGGGGMALPYLGSERRVEEIEATRRRDGDIHLRSVKAVTGYHIHASDGEIGHIEDFLVEDVNWSIHYLVVDTANWWLGEKVLISPRLARKIDWAERLVNLNVDRQRVKHSPLYDASTTVDWAYENHYHKYYGDIAPGDLF